MANASKQKVIHLELKRPDGNKHRYYGSKAAIYDDYTSTDLGIGYGHLRDYGDLSKAPYENSKCVIRQGYLQTKKKNA